MKKSKNKVLDGVCAGIAEWLGIDPVWIRLIFALNGWVFPYIILMLILEEK